ncbi:MAG: IS200/IS605 family accessory protein TnpB-related protein, partial [Cyanobacteria bacterium J06628_3]
KLQGKFVMFSFPLSPYWTSGQRKAALRDIAADIVYLAQLFNCGLAAEGLDFAVKKSQMRHSGSSKHNRMLSGLAYDGFRTALMSAADKVGVQVKFVCPRYTSTTGIAKYMAIFGLNSGMAAGIIIARKAMGFTEKVTKKYYTGFLKTDSDLEKPQRITWQFLHSLTRESKITRHSRFNIATYIKALIERFHEKSKRRRKPALNSNPISRA